MSRYVVLCPQCERDNLEYDDEVQEFVCNRCGCVFDTDDCILDERE